MRTDYELVLQVASMGQELRRATCPTSKGTGKPMTANQWVRYWVTRFQRYKKPPTGALEAIANNDLIVGWSNFDDLRKAGMTHDEIAEILEFLQL